MAVITYEIPSGRIVHETRVDFSYRSVQKPIHIVQYDKQLPIIAVSLYVSGKTYTLPANIGVNVKFGKRDRTFVYKPVLGCNVARNIVYFEVDEQMSFIHGPANPILELSFIDGGEPQRAGSSPIAIEIDRNPIQESDIESSNEYSICVEEAANDGKTYARKNKSWVEIPSDDNSYEPDGVTIVLNDDDELEVSKNLEVEWTKVVNKPTFSTVATTGSYNDLGGKPDLTEKLDKNFSSLPDQESPLLTDVLAINRGTVVQKTTLGKLLAQVDAEIFIITATLPATGVVNKIYLVPKGTPEAQNTYDEFIWVNSAWENLGTIALDLSNYYNKTEVSGLLETKVDKNNAITAGTKTKITYDAKGLVTGGSDLVASDIPQLAPSKITQDANNRFVTDNEKSTWNGKVTSNSAITGATKTKITYDSKGLVTSGDDLAESDIPTLPASKITQDANNRFVTDNDKSTWNGKQNALTPGDGISISGNVISATNEGYPPDEATITLNGNDELEATNVAIWRYV